jgi:hypothetical protein
MGNKEIDIELIKKLCQNEDNIIITQHTLTRCMQRNISIDEILQTIENGEIIEQYPEDYPHPSCLIFGVTLNNKVIHVVCGTDNLTIWIITAYIPNTIKWEDDLKIRRKEN